MGSLSSKEKYNESCINYISNRNDSIDTIKYQVKVKKFLKIIENNWDRYEEKIYKTVFTKDIFLEKLRDNLLDKNTRKSSIKTDINFIIDKINKKTKTYLEYLKEIGGLRPESKEVETIYNQITKYNENNQNNVDLLNLLFNNVYSTEHGMEEIIIICKLGNDELINITEKFKKLKDFETKLFTITWYLINSPATINQSNYR